MTFDPHGITLIGWIQSAFLPRSSTTQKYYAGDQKSYDTGSVVGGKFGKIEWKGWWNFSMGHCVKQTAFLFLFRSSGFSPSCCFQLQDSALKCEILARKLKAFPISLCFHSQPTYGFNRTELLKQRIQFPTLPCHLHWKSVCVKQQWEELQFCWHC